MSNLIDITNDANKKYNTELTYYVNVGAIKPKDVKIYIYEIASKFTKKIK